MLRQRIGFLARFTRNQEMATPLIWCPLNWEGHPRRVISISWRWGLFACAPVLQ